MLPVVPEQKESLDSYRFSTYRPQTLKDSRAPSCATLTQAMELTGLVDASELAAAFAAEGVTELSLAGALTLDEVRTVLEIHGLQPSVGRVRQCLTALRDAAAASTTHESENLLQATPRSVLMRSVLRQEPADVRENLAMRFTAESVFAALMLTVAFEAILSPPDVDLCVEHVNSTSYCGALLSIYASSWSLSAGFFICSSLVSLASMQVFLPVGTVHFVAVAAEAYLSKSMLFITFGFGSVIIALHVTLFLSYASSPIGIAVAMTFFWACWAFQFWQARRAVMRVFSEMPGFDGFLAFFWGYVGLGGGLASVDVDDDQSKLAALARAAERLDQVKRGGTERSLPVDGAMTPRRASSQKASSQKLNAAERCEQARRKSAEVANL